MCPLIRLSAFLAFVLVASSPIPACGQQAIREDGVDEATPIFLNWSTGFDFSRGDYGLEDRTTVYYVPMNVTIDYKQFRTRVSFPFLASSGPMRIGATKDEILTGEARGFGQLQVDLSYLFVPEIAGLPYLEVSGKISAPTETRRALGTGLWSFALQGEMFKSFGRFTPYLGAGRRFYEACGCRQQLDDRFFTSIGISGRLSEELSVGVGYDWLEAARSDIADSHEIVPYASYWLSDDWSLGPYVVIGLSDGSPQYGVGFSMSLRR